MRNATYKKTGKCAYCGESTSLLIHDGCGDRYRKSHKPQLKKAPKKKKYAESFIQAMIDNEN